MPDSVPPTALGSSEYQAAVEEHMRRQARETAARIAISAVICVGLSLLTMGTYRDHHVFTVVGTALAVPPAIAAGTRYAEGKRSAADSLMLLAAALYAIAAALSVF
jgi:hypothetical protein